MTTTLNMLPDDHGFIESASGRFYCSPQRFQQVLLGKSYYAVYDKNMSGHPVAWINHDNGVVSGVVGNSGNRIDRLQPIDNVDIATLAHKMISAGFVLRLPTSEEQNEG